METQRDDDKLIDGMLDAWFGDDDWRESNLLTPEEMERHIASTRKDMRRVLEAVRTTAAARIEELETALRWYAGDGSTYDGIDVGQRARAALAEGGRADG